VLKSVKPIFSHVPGTISPTGTISPEPFLLRSFRRLRLRDLAGRLDKLLGLLYFYYNATGGE
jgi:hypothetical protein